MTQDMGASSQIEGLLPALENICANAANSAYIEVLHAGRVKRRTSRFGLLRETYSHEYAAAARDGVHRYLWPQLVKLAQAMGAPEPQHTPTESNHGN